MNIVVTLSSHTGRVTRQYECYYHAVLLGNVDHQQIQTAQVSNTCAPHNRENVRYRSNTVKSEQWSGMRLIMLRQPDYTVQIHLFRTYQLIIYRSLIWLGSDMLHCSTMEGRGVKGE